MREATKTLILNILKVTPDIQECLIRKNMTGKVMTLLDILSSTAKEIILTTDNVKFQLNFYI